MASIQVPTYSNQSQPVATGDSGATKNTLAYRDNNGDSSFHNLAALILESTGAVQFVSPTAITGTFTVTPTATIWLVDGTSGTFTVTLPPAAGIPGYVFVFTKKDAANNVTIKGNGSENINGANTSVMSSQYGSLRVVSDGTQWWTW